MGQKLTKLLRIKQIKILKILAMLLNIDELRENRHLASETIKDLKQLIHVLNGKPAKNFQDIDLLIQMQTDLLRTKDMKKFLDEKYLTICN